MKRILSLILAVLIMVPAFVLGVCAEGEATTSDAGTASCTIGKQNIASEASVGYIGNRFWGIREAALVDGDTNTLSHSPSQTSFTYTLKFGKAFDINEVMLYINGTAKCPACGNIEHSANAGNHIKSVQLTMYDDTGKEVYKSETIQTAEEVVDGLTTTWKLEEEVKFEFSTLSVASVNIAVKSNSYGSALFREIEIYQETGEHAWALNDQKSTPSTCEAEGENAYDCACGATKKETTNAHVVEEWTTVQAPTTKNSGTAEGHCTVPGCGGIGSKILPRLTLNSNEFPIDLSKLTFTEIIQTGTRPSVRWDDVDKVYYIESEEPAVTQIPNEGRDYNNLFNNIIETDTWAPDDFWCGTGWTQNVIEVDDDPETEDIYDPVYKVKTEDDPSTPDKNELAYETESFYSTLKIEFDQVYTLTTAELYVYANWCSFNVSFYDADNNAVLSVEKSGLQTDGYGRLIFTGEIYGKDVKYIVITVKDAKWDGGKGLAFTEFKLGAHQCEYEQSDIEAGTKENCVTTFSGKCTICSANRTEAKITVHTPEKDLKGEDPTQDKIIETITEKTCYSNGIVMKHCSICDTDILDVSQATGEHVFERQEVLVEPTCGAAGSGYEKCTTTGCTATTEEHSIDPTGNHKYNWTELEDDKADYTHEGTKVWTCSVCADVDESKGTQASPMKSANIVSSQDWSIRYTDFVSPRATFKINLRNVDKIEEEGYDIKIYAYVQKGETVKEMQIYGVGATGNFDVQTGEFSLVARNSTGYADEYKFYVKTVITSSDNASADAESTSKAVAGNTDGTISTNDIAKYYCNSESRLSKIESNYGEEVKNFYLEIYNQLMQ